MNQHEVDNSGLNIAIAKHNPQAWVITSKKATVPTWSRAHLSSLTIYINYIVNVIENLGRNGLLFWYTYLGA